MPEPFKAFVNAAAKPRGRTEITMAQGVTLREAKSVGRSEEHTSELQSPCNLVCRLLLEKKKKQDNIQLLYAPILALTTTRQHIRKYSQEQRNSDPEPKIRIE